MATKVKPCRIQATGTPQAGYVPKYVDEDTFQWGAGGGGGGSDIVYATQAEYNALLPGALTDGKHYFIYTSSEPSIYTTVTCYIDESKSDPSQMVTYGNDVTWTAGSSDWDTFFGYYPCLLNTSGVETAVLDTTDYSKDTDGNSVNITSGDNVMVAFPRLGIKMSKSGTVITLQITNKPNASGFSYLAHSRVNSDKNKFYMGAYKAYNSNNVLKSWSGVSPTTSISNDNSRTYARANGTGYEMSAYYQRMFIQCLYVMKYKNLNSQAVIGNGYVGGSSEQTTGATNTSGMNYGNTSSTTDRVKLFGVEDLRGNVFEWCEGYYGNGSNHYLAYDNFNLTQTNYSTTFTREMWNGYIQNVYGTSELGFMSSVTGGSGTTYYCDINISYGPPQIPFVGGRYGMTQSAEAGIFQMFANNADGAYNDIGARIMYL